MGYSIHIERPAANGAAAPITAGEWRDAVSQITALRLAKAPGSTTLANPRTGEVLGVSTPADTAEMRIDGEWRPLMFYDERHGAISFDAPADFDDENSLLRRIARAMAKSLRAQIIGDEGEPYR